MEKFLNVYLFVACIVLPCFVAVLFLAKATEEHNYKKEIQQIKEDVRQLTNDIDEYGDIDTYTDSDHFERLYMWSHGMKKTSNYNK